MEEDISHSKDVKIETHQSLEQSKTNILSLPLEMMEIIAVYYASSNSISNDYVLTCKNFLDSARRIPNLCILYDLRVIANVTELDILKYREITNCVQLFVFDEEKDSSFHLATRFQHVFPILDENIELRRRNLKPSLNLIFLAAESVESKGLENLMILLNSLEIMMVNTRKEETVLLSQMPPNSLKALHIPIHPSKKQMSVLRKFIKQCNNLKYLGLRALNKNESILKDCLNLTSLS